MPVTLIKSKWTSGELEFYDQASGNTLFRLGVTDKLAFFGVTPVVRPTAYTQTYVTAEKTHAAVTQATPPAGGTGATAGAYDTAANRDLMIASITAGAADLLDLKQLVNSVIDDLQALGILQ